MKIQGFYISTIPTETQKRQVWTFERTFDLTESQLERFKNLIKLRWKFITGLEIEVYEELFN